MINNKPAGKKIVVSFSGGLTSAYMLIKICEEWKSENTIIPVFANTGLEHEKTLEFVDAIANHIGVNVFWVEYSNTMPYKLVNLRTASRNGQPFIEAIEKYGVPSKPAPKCTSILKRDTIRRFVSANYGHGYYTAIGIRLDEIDRMSTKAKKMKLIYPLIESFPATKLIVNNYFQTENIPQLGIPAYAGNCISCWKKSDQKISRALNEYPDQLDFWRKIENLYSYRVMPQHKTSKIPLFAFRGNRSVDEMAKIPFQTETLFTDQDFSCDIYSDCGIDN